PLTVGGITYENGVGLLVKDTILGDFFPGGKCRRFEVAFGLDARAHRDARTVLNVWGDERLLATSGEVGTGEAEGKKGGK
ncbi:MAG: NPCBM/NEW2 domain-containing protein, partial [bacterium]|nr:NPCBM/NEW2 domain-containing protein [bacterium]